MSLAFSFIDLVVVLVILGSVGYATWRGFVSETLSIVAWAVAAFASLYLGPWVGRLAHSLIETPWIAIVTGYALVFVAIFIPMQFASHRFSEGVRRSPVGPLDRVLGATFGVVRGLAILGLAYIVFTAFVPIREQPRWIKEARTLPLIQASAQVLADLVPDNGGLPPRYEHKPPPAAAPPAPKPEPTAKPATKPKPGKKHVKKGYGAGDRRALDRLFETTGNGGGNR